MMLFGVKNSGDSIAQEKDCSEWPQVNHLSLRKQYVFPQSTMNESSSEPTLSPALTGMCCLLQKALVLVSCWILESF